LVIILTYMVIAALANRTEIPSKKHTSFTTNIDQTFPNHLSMASVSKISH
jgi:hypothetical protein